MIGLAATATYLPETWMSAAEIAGASGIPEQVILEKFGLRGKHIAGADEHVSDMSVEAASRLLGQNAIDPADIDVVMYYGSLWKDYPVWQAAPWIAHRLGCKNAYALEYANVSCGTPVALRLARNFLLAEPDLRNVLIVAACRESHLLDYGNERSRFMFNFGDGAVAGLLTRDDGHELLGCHALTDGSFSLQVKVPAGGSVEPASAESVAGRRHFLDVADPAEMKGGLDEVSLPNFVAAATWRGRALGCEAGGCVLPLRDPHEALDARRDRRRARRPARRLSRRHRPHERRRLAARPRPGVACRRALGGRSRPAAGGGDGLHLGGVGGPMVIEDLIGQELVSEWRSIEQERIDEFAHATDDPQWIHTDPEAAAAGPFGTTIAHGFLTLSLVVPMFAEALPPLEGYGMTLNYGLNRVRFTSPVPSGARIRGRFRVEDVEDVAFGKQARVAATIELEGQEKPACVAEALFRFLNPA